MIDMNTFIDVSEHQGMIDWDKVKAAGIDGVIIRAGYGRGNIDKEFHHNINGAILAGIKNIGIYWFSYAFKEGMGIVEASYCKALLKEYKKNINLPVFFDWEYDSRSYAMRQGYNLTRTEITAIVREFCETMRDAGYQAGYYTNLDYQENIFLTEELTDFKKWLAYYTSEQQTDCYLWQYTEKGFVDGIGQCDKNLLVNGSAEEEVIMQTLKSGSQGKAVAVWQIIVSAIPDGTFGAETLKATMIFQEENGLEPDGIVGPKTWKKGLESL